MCESYTDGTPNLDYTGGLRSVDWSRWDPPQPANFFGVDRSESPIRGLRWEGITIDEVRSYNNDQIDALMYAFRATLPATPPDTWPEFLNNWGDIGRQHERKVFCQPLLGD